ncbi:hypothetical protein DYB37_001522 [Aphanomyces astaci]|uniref:Uncharacterized protein n=1 Tax=Aphanomyces astaci TaxID=112090 RepID=A0A3R6XGB6_APHAT|nr:hypothetical protein DYB35_000809 [Aphanomyces astaci]RHZ12094.1 hypothetical protein DYB37_001522 [Aphanomyces astaci]
MASSQATSMDDGGGVVLSAIALRHLEVEKANLRFKLADAEKQSELRHGQVAAYESKIQDLLLLVEMNKKVAAEALKCSTNTAHKLEEANEQLERWQARGMASLARRRRRRHLAQVLVTLQCHAGRMRSWCRILTRRRQAALRLAFVRWNIAPSRHAAQLSTAVPSFHVPSQHPTSVVRSLDALQHCLEKQALALIKPLRRNVFSSWKGSLSTTRGQEYTAQVWHKRQLRYLLRRVWLVWTTHVSNRATCRRANRRQRLRLRWQRWVKYRWVQLRRRYLIVKIVDGHRRRQMVQCYVRWQLQSKNDQIATWLTCLEGAKIALAEERSACAKQKADVEAHLEHQTAAEHERHRAIGNHIDLCLRFLRWGGYVRLQHRVNVLAYQHATQRTAQLARKLLFRWRRMRHLRQTSGQFSRQFKAQNLRRYARQVLFQWWRLCRRTKLLGRLTTKRTRAMLAAGLSKLVAGSVRRHKEQQLQLHLKYSHRVNCSGLSMFVWCGVDLKLGAERCHTSTNLRNSTGTDTTKPSVGCFTTGGSLPGCSATFPSLRLTLAKHELRVATPTDLCGGRFKHGIFGAITSTPNERMPSEVCGGASLGGSGPTSKRLASGKAKCTGAF